MAVAEWEKEPCRVCGREIGPIRDPRAPTVCARAGCFESWMRLKQWRADKDVAGFLGLGAA